MSSIIWQGASVLLFDEDAPIFALKFKENIAYLTGIGGKVEHSESHRHCAIRETMEETGAELTIIDTPQCSVIDFEGQVKNTKSENGAIAIIHKAAKSPQGKPWDYSLTQQKLCVEIFLGKLNQAPQPIEKHPVFVAIKPQILREVLHNGLNIAQAYAEQSIRIVGGKLPENLPTKVFIADSLEALFIALADDLESFLDDADELLGDLKQPPNVSL